jgi:hypothetical protein
MSGVRGGLICTSGLVITEQRPTALIGGAVRGVAACWS